MNNKNMLVICSGWKNIIKHNYGDMNVQFNDIYEMLKKYYNNKKLQFCLIVAISGDEHPSLRELTTLPPHTSVYEFIHGDFPEDLQSHEKLKNAKFDIIWCTECGASSLVYYYREIINYCKNDGICFFSGGAKLTKNNLEEEITNNINWLSNNLTLLNDEAVVNEHKYELDHEKEITKDLLPDVKERYLHLEQLKSIDNVKQTIQKVINYYRQLLINKDYVFDGIYYAKPFFLYDLCINSVNGMRTYKQKSLNENVTNFYKYLWNGLNKFWNNELLFIDSFEQVKGTYIYKLKRKTGGSYYKKYLKYKTKYLKLKNLH
jgi:hypothetical protein